MKLNEIKELLLTIDKTNITKFDIQLDNFKMYIEKGDTKQNTIQKNIVIENNNEITYEKEELDYEQEEINESVYIVSAPLVGTFYNSSNPAEAPYVKVGSKVKKGDTLCILEAMKLMNEIECEVDGEIIEILVKNEDLVEYGKPLFKIKLEG